MMKTVRAFLFILFVSLISACGSASEPPATPFAESMKGYELYSWQDNGAWKFALLVGTNREKSLEEIKSAETVFSGLEELISALERMPEGQYVIWSSKETLSFPPEEIIEQVAKICEERGLILNRAV
jgi:hypothetical protein